MPSFLVLVLVMLWSGACVGKNVPADTEETPKCDKRPQTVTEPIPADGRFVLSVEGVIKKQYLPGKHYTVRLQAEPNSAFASFLIMAEGELVQNKNNHRKDYYKLAGTLRPKEKSPVPAEMHPYCNNSVQQSNNSPKTMVEVDWLAPPKGQGCVTLHAMVAESPDVWYMDDAPLSSRVCEDTRRIEDIEPLPTPDCQACEEAKYQLTFEGHWSRNTHPHKFPVEATWRRFSDLVGVSHATSYYLWDYGVKASAGLKLLSEAGNTTLLEKEIQDQFGSGVRTVIKASGYSGAQISEPTSAIFRADKQNHLISIASSIVPSPDWFVGVTHFELCLENNTWVQERDLNLYPIDAGTDNGVSYESSNEETLPPGLITRILEHADNAQSPFYSTAPGTPRRFAKIRVKLLRLYKETCQGEASNTVNQSQSSEDLLPENDDIEVDASVASEVTSTAAGDGTCELSEWHEWFECAPACGSHRQRYRERSYTINGVPYTYNRDNNGFEMPPPGCDNVLGDLSEIESCEPKECS